MAITYLVTAAGNYVTLCLSSDTKPTATTGGMLLEMDTGKNFKYSGGVWVEAELEVAWGNISGTLSDQTDLQDELDAKADALGSDENYVTDDEKTKLSNIAVSQAVDLDTIETNANNVPAIKTKTDNISVTQAVNLDTMESDIALKAPLASPAFTGTPTGITKSHVGLGNVDNTSDASKPVSTATQTALDAKQATLVSATNIKTINGSSVLGSGDLAISGSGISLGLAVVTSMGYNGY